MTSSREQAFRETPRGRFLEALQHIADGGGYAGEVAEASCLYRECLGHGRLDVAAVGRIIRLLNAVPVRDARGAVNALADLLIEEHS